jgi:hypothetical protein
MTAVRTTTRQVVTVDRLCKSYRPGMGMTDVSFAVPPGEIFGIIGPNGARAAAFFHHPRPAVLAAGRPGDHQRRAGRDHDLHPGDRWCHLRWRAPARAVARLPAVRAAGHRREFAIGLLIAALAPSAPIAGVAGTVLLYPLLFLAGLWTPKQNLSPLLQHIGNYSPLGAAVQAMDSAMQGNFPPARPLLVMAAYAVVLGLIAIRSFRWE